MTMLVFQLEDGKEMKCDLSAEVVTLGRADDNDIVVQNDWISSHHARFERAGGELRVVDLDSRNGVMLNGQRVTNEVLNPGDMLVFGQLEAVVRDQPAAQPARPPAAATVPLVSGIRAPQPLVPRPGRLHPPVPPAPGAP